MKDDHADLIVCGLIAAGGLVLALRGESAETVGAGAAFFLFFGAVFLVILRSEKNHG